MDQLPKDIFLEVLTSLPTYNVGQLAKCNRRLSWFCKIELIWKHKFKTDYLPTSMRDEPKSINTWRDLYLRYFQMIPTYGVKPRYVGKNCYFFGRGYLNRNRLLNAYHSQINLLFDHLEMCIFVDSSNTVKWITIILKDETYTFPEHGPRIFKNTQLFCYVINSMDFNTFIGKYQIERYFGEADRDYARRIYLSSSKFTTHFPKDKNTNFVTSACNVVLNKSLKYVGMIGSYVLYGINDPINLEHEMFSLKRYGCKRISYKRYLALTVPRQFIYTIKYMDSTGQIVYKMYNHSISEKINKLILIHKGVYKV